HEEMGQGTHTSLVMLLCEELGCDPEQVTTAFAPVDPAYAHSAFGIQVTGGSSSTWSAYEQMRKAGAAARAMLVAAAARRFALVEEALFVEHARVREKAGTRSASFGELAEAASKL